MLRKKVRSLEMEVKDLEELCKELKSNHADDVVQIELLRESMLDFDRSLKSIHNDMKLLKVVFSPINTYKDGSSNSWWGKK